MSRPIPSPRPHRGLVFALILALVASLADASMPPAPVTAADHEVTPVVDGGVGCLAGAPRPSAPRNPGDPPPPPREPAVKRPPDPGDPPPPEDSAKVRGVLAGVGTPWVAGSKPMPPAQAAPTSSPDPTVTPSPVTEPTLTPDPSASPSASPTPTPTSEPEPTPTPDRSATLLPGIDISHHNGDIDFTRVMKAGKRFVFMKATQDVAFVDPRFPQNVQRARASGIAHGAYHFFDYHQDGRVQADHFLDRVEAAGGLEGSLPPVVDVECWRPIGPSIHVLSVARLRDFVDRVYGRTGRLPIVYTSVRMWREVMGDAPDFGHLPLWAACWGCESPVLPAGWSDWVVWQSGMTRIPKVGRLDGNFFNGSEVDLEALRSGPLQLVGGTPYAGASRVDLDVSHLDGREVRTSPDGTIWGEWQMRRDSVPLDLPLVEGEQRVYVQLRQRPDLESPVFLARLVMDLTPPTVLAPVVALTLGEVDVGGPVPAIRVAARWKAGDEVSGLSAGAPLTVVCAGTRTRGTAMAAAPPMQQLAGRTAGVEAPLAEECRLQVTERDGAGNVARSSSVPFTLEFLGGDVSAGLSVAADQAAVVATPGPDQGIARVLLDGQPVAEIDLWSPVPADPQVVFVTDLDPEGTHELVVEPTGRSSPRAGSQPEPDASAQPGPDASAQPDPGMSPPPGPGTEARVDGVLVLRHLGASSTPAGSVGQRSGSDSP